MNKTRIIRFRIEKNLIIDIDYLMLKHKAKSKSDLLRILIKNDCSYKL